MLSSLKLSELDCSRPRCRCIDFDLLASLSSIRSILESSLMASFFDSPVSFFFGFVFELSSCAAVRLLIGTRFGVSCLNSLNLLLDLLKSTLFT